MRDLKIYYKDFNCINKKFDEKIEKLAEKFGLKFAGSGYNFVEKARNIHFIKKEKKGRDICVG